jgi:non-specific serine/threonine protein kinase
LPETEFDPLIGRDAELQRVLDALEEARLVSLTGPGGTGKTRLAAAAIATLEAGGRAAWFVDASAVTVPKLLAAAIATTLRLDGGSSEPRVAVSRALSGRAPILALDNLEQIRGAGAAVADLLRSTPDLQVLATTRVPLGVRGELELAIPPLRLPASDDPIQVEASAAGALYFARARSLGRQFIVDAGLAKDVAALVRRLDGLPLGIELAAARGRIMTPAEILRRLDAHGVAGIDGPAADPHRSLAGVIEWTIRQLTNDQAEVLASVASCRGFDLDLAEALLPGRDVAGALEVLVSLGLIQVDAVIGGVTRLRLLETIRADVLRRLPDHLRELGRTHLATAMSRRAKDLAARTGLDDTIPALEGTIADADNFRLALDWLELARPEEALRLWRQLSGLWETQSRFQEGTERYERLARSASKPTTALARASATYADLMSEFRGPAVARPHYERALALAEQSGDRRSQIQALRGLAVAAIAHGDSAAGQAASTALEGLEASIEVEGERLLLAEAKWLIAASVDGAASDGVLRELQTLVANCEEAGDLARTLTARRNLVVLHLWRREFRSVAIEAEQAVTLARALHSDRLGSLLCLLAIARAELDTGDRGVTPLLEAAGDAGVSSSMFRASEVLEAAIPVAWALGQPILAAELWGAVDATTTRHGWSWTPEQQEFDAEVLGRVRRRRGEIEVELAIRRGASADPIAMLRSLAGRLEQPDVRPSRRFVAGRHEALTRREVEVLILIASGRHDREIAGLLSISQKTASVHASNIKSKLGLESRLDVALWAREQGLAAGDDV